MIPETRERLQDSERAVSPVIGVILMVAITVILAAVIAAFVLGFGADQDSAPQATLEVDQSPDTNNGSAGTITFNHQGGDGINLEDVSLIGPAPDSDLTANENGTMTGGESFTFDITDGQEDEEYNLVWQPGTDDSQVLRSVTLSSDWASS